MSVFSYWSFTKAVPLTGGSHTIAVVARGTGGTGSNAVVSGDSTSVLQGELDILTLKR